MASTPKKPATRIRRGDSQIEHIERTKVGAMSRQRSQPDRRSPWKKRPPKENTRGR